MQDKNLVDKRLVTNSIETTHELDSYTLPHPLFDQYGGIFYDKEYKHWLRLEKEWADGMSWGLNVLKHMPSGGRTRFSTDSDFFELTITMDPLWICSNIPLTSSAGFLLLEDLGDGEFDFVAVFRPEGNKPCESYKQSCRLKGGKMRNYTLWWPIYHKITGVTISLNKGSQIGHGAKYRDIKPILYYGGSTTQGCCSSRCDTSFEGFISKWTNIDFINMGFSGNAYGEPEMAEYLATHFDPSIFVYAYDWNAPTHIDLEKTHLPFYKKFRELHPNTPIVMMSMAATFDNKENGDSSAKRLKIIRKTLKYAKDHGDNNICLLNGQTIFKGEFKHLARIDSDHPTDLGFYIMAKALYRKLKPYIQEK